MRVFIIKHEVSGDTIICHNLDDAIQTLERCLWKQDGQSIKNRQALRVEVTAMPKPEYEALEESRYC